ncbi:hypothetical protein FACS1894151_09180 [Spirochaetia bacterium]|nr:hypothetical protein FACS1894151_09180 [Spirochaetia bacterium]
MYLKIIPVIVLLSAGSVLFAQNRTPSQNISFEFIDQNISDILYAFSTYAGLSIIADDTVSGRASFQFSGNNFDQAFDSFLLINRLYVDKSASLWIVSRIYISVDNRGTITLNALDASPSQLLEKLSRKLNATIVQDVLPATRLSLHVESTSLAEAVTLVMKPFPDYSVMDETTYIQVRRNPISQTSIPLPSSSIGEIHIRESGGFYDVTIANARLGEILEKLFAAAGREYISFARSDQLIERAQFSNKLFNESLALILEQGNGEYTAIDDIWYIFPLQQSDIIRQLRDNDKVWRRFDLKYIATGELLPFIQSRYQGIQTITVSGGNYFYAFITDENNIELQRYIRSMDEPVHSSPVRLRYIRTEALFRTLPPSVKREELVDAGDGMTVFFLGSDERREKFLEDIAILDRPQPQIRYDLFIIQVQDTSNLDWGMSVSARETGIGDTTMVTGELGSILNLNFDIITVFGYQAAARINAALSENKAKVVADTTLFGLSGQEIKFQNTDTYRYRDSNIDPETGKPTYTGITREITSGLILNITGWVSGDGMVTTSVNATVSKRGADVSSTVGNPPPTSERIVTTQVRSRSGEPVVLSGLKQTDTTEIESGVPWLKDIPLLGWLFKSVRLQQEETQMIIYLVPHVDIENDTYTIEGLKTASMYERFVVPFLQEQP